MRKGEPVTAVPVRPARPLWWTAVAVLAMTLAAGNVTAATLGTSAGVTIVSPLNVTITIEKQLRFGQLECEGACSGGTVEVTTGGVRTVLTGNVVLGVGTIGPAEITISGGVAGQAYVITLTTPAPMFSCFGAGCTPLNANTLSPDAPGFNRQFGAGGVDTVLVGGILTVPAGTPGGNYRGDVLLTVAFQ